MLWTPGWTITSSRQRARTECRPRIATSLRGASEACQHSGEARTMHIRADWVYIVLTTALGRYGMLGGRVCYEMDAGVFGGGSCFGSGRGRCAVRADSD